MTDTKETQSKPPQIYRSDQIDIYIANYLTSTARDDISKFFNKKYVNVKESDASYRAINHWESLGLLDDTRTDKQGWRKFSLLDLIWIKIILILREFGLSNKKILQVKQSLSKFPKFSEYSNFGYLEFYISAAYFHKKATYLLIFDDGLCEPVLEDEIAFHQIGFPISDHIKINLNEILTEIFPDKDLSPKSETKFSLSDEEIEIIEKVRLSDFDELSIKMKDGDVKYIDRIKTIDVNTRLNDLAKEEKYQDILSKYADGKLVSIKQKIKNKLDK